MGKKAPVIFWKYQFFFLKWVFSCGGKYEIYYNRLTNVVGFLYRLFKFYPDLLAKSYVFKIEDSEIKYIKGNDFFTNFYLQIY